MRGGAEPGAPGRWINCGTVMAGLGFLVFAFFGWILIQLICSGQGPGAGWMTPDF